MTPEMTRLLEAAEEAAGAMRAMLTAQPFQMTERSERLEKACRELEGASRLVGIAASRHAGQDAHSATPTA